MNLNKVFLIGRLTHDPEARTTGSGQTVTTIRMATNRVWYDQNTREKKEATEYHQVIAWARLGEIASQYLQKGAMCLIEGRIQTRSWDDQASGQKKYRTEIIAENLQLGPRAGGSGGNFGGNPKPVADIKKPAPSGNDAGEPRGHSPTDEADIPVINEDTGTNMGLEEENEKPINENDLPF